MGALKPLPDLLEVWLPVQRGKPHGVKVAIVSQRRDPLPAVIAGEQNSAANLDAMTPLLVAARRTISRQAHHRKTIPSLDKDEIESC